MPLAVRWIWQDRIASRTLIEIQKQYPQLQKSADAADNAAKTAARQLELAERPWIAANIERNGPLTFNVNGANIPIKITMRNTGNSPALYAVIS